MFKDRLRGFEDIRRVYNFDDFVAGYRPAAADKNLKMQYSMCLEVRVTDGRARVFCRAKARIAASTPWNGWEQLYPSLRDLEEREPHAPATVPAVSANNPWPEFATKVVPSLTRYQRRLPSTTHIHTQPPQVLQRRHASRDPNPKVRAGGNAFFSSEMVRVCLLVCVHLFMLRPTCRSRG